MVSSTDVHFHFVKLSLMISVIYVRKGIIFMTCTFNTAYHESVTVIDLSFVSDREDNKVERSLA